MNFPQLIASLSTYFAMPFLELPGLDAQLKMAPEFRADLMKKELELEYKKSAVSILLYPDEDNNTKIVFIKRNEYEGVHSGQIGLPGGKYEDEDVNTIQTALREMKEEIGVEIPSDRVLGRLTPLKVPVSKFEIFPVVTYASETPTFVREEAEVQEIIEFSFEELYNAEPLSTKFKGSSGLVFTAPYYLLNAEKLWGATAMIISEFLEVVRINQR